jgi:hypothetical protein
MYASTRTNGSPTAVANGARPAMFFAAGVVGFGTALSFLIPRVTVARTRMPVVPGPVDVAGAGSAG